MQPAIKSQIPVRVKNSYNPIAVGTVIKLERDKKDSLVTAITSKSNVKLVDIVSTRMLGQFGFMSKVFATFESCEVSVDVVASSDISLSVTLDSKQIRQKKGNLAKLRKELSEIATVNVFEEKAIVSMICNTDRSAEVLATAFKVLAEEGIKVEMLSQGASKVNISMVVASADKDRLIKALHKQFFEKNKNSFDQSQIDE